MKERPILFSGPMVRAILEGRKTQTRRAVKGDALMWLEIEDFQPQFIANLENGLCPFGKPGDRLWVRETWRVRNWAEGDPITIEFRDGAKMQAWEASEEWEERMWEETTLELTAKGCTVDEHNDCFIPPEGETELPLRWRPSIHMPRCASRLNLEIVSVRVERLNQISEADAKAEGTIYHNGGNVGHSGWRPTSDFGTVGPTPIHAFAWLFESIYGTGSFDDRWVWVVEFKRV